jgi:hypothetical protein
MPELQTTQTHIEQIKAMYTHFEQFLLRNGVVLAKDTGVGYWGVTNVHDLHEALTHFEIHKHSHLLDLGSGDGRVVLLAAAHGIKATGVEADEWLINCSLDIKRKLNLPQFQNVLFLKDDFMKMDISNYDLLYVSPDKPFHRGLEQKLVREIKGKLIVHGFEFLPRALKCEKEFMSNGERFGLYGR